VNPTDKSHCRSSSAHLNNIWEKRKKQSLFFLRVGNWKQPLTLKKSFSHCGGTTTAAFTISEWMHQFGHELVSVIWSAILGPRTYARAYSGCTYVRTYVAARRADISMQYSNLIENKYGDGCSWWQGDVYFFFLKFSMHATLVCPRGPW
jgi:hypothetical protein